MFCLIGLHLLEDGIAPRSAGRDGAERIDEIEQELGVLEPHDRRIRTTAEGCRFEASSD